MRTKIYLKKVTNETCRDVRNCKIVNEKEQYDRAHPKCLNFNILQDIMKEVATQHKKEECNMTKGKK
jgi:hypothetical protein